MIHSILWRIPSLSIVPMILALAVWFHFNHHLIERCPNHSHIRIESSHTHNDITSHSHDKETYLGINTFTKHSTAVMAATKNNQDISNMQVKPVGGVTHILTNTVLAPKTHSFTTLDFRKVTVYSTLV